MDSSKVLKIKPIQWKNVYPDILGTSLYFVWTWNQTGISLGLLPQCISSGILSGISSGICSGISSGISSGQFTQWRGNNLPIWQWIIVPQDGYLFWHSIWHISWHLMAFYLAYLLAFYLAVEVQRCTLSWAGPRLRSSGAHWAGQVPGWGPAVHTEGRSPVEVQRCTLSWAAPRLRSSGAHWAKQLAGWGPAVRTELGSWRRAWRRVGKVGKAEVEVEQGGSGGGRGGGKEEGEEDS